MKKLEDVLASVVLLAEDTGIEHTKAAIENVLQQSHQNLEIIVAALFDDTDLKKLYNNNWKVKFQDAEEGVEFIAKVIDECTGDAIFYKTVTNVLWFPNHIKAHLEDFRTHAWKNKWSLSHIEIRDEDNPDHPLNTIGYRIENPPQLEKIILDEIVHLPDVTPDWPSCVVKDDDDNINFIPGNALVEWHKAELKGTIPKEITVVQWIKQGGEQVADEDLATKIGLPAATDVKEENIFNQETGEVEIKRKIPTIVGNVFLDEQYNNGIRNVVNETKDIETIGIKRTMGMGDIVLVEPVIRALKSKYPSAKITLYTAKPAIVDYFEAKPDDIVTLEDNQLIQDFLATTDNDVKYDLDLAYESRTGRSFIDSYFDTIGMKVNHKDKIPKLVGSNHNVKDSVKVPDSKYVVVVGDGSGWIGKTWNPAEYTKVVQYLLDKGYEVVEPGIENYSGLTDTKWNSADFPTLVKLLQFCDLFVGGDNGPMHIASAFNRKRVLIAGSALPYFTNPNREGVYYVQDNSLDCLGCKHKQFFGTNGQQITFMPQCDNDEQGICMQTLKAEHVIGGIEKLMMNNPISMIDKKTPLNFMLNIPGWSYYKDEKLDLIQRERLTEHPDQDKDISTEYADRWEQVYKDHALPLAKELKKYTDSKRLLDVGCNMGIFVKAAIDEGFDAYGIDINKKSVERAHEVFPELKEKIIDDPDTDVCCRLGSESHIKLFDIITANQVLEHMSDPIDFMESIKAMLDDNGVLLIGSPCWEEEGAQELWHKWGSFGTGEHTWIPTEKSFAEICKKAGFDYKLIEDTKNGLLSLCYKI